MVLQLEKIIKSQDYSETSVKEVFSAFECKQDKDICYFLNNLALDFEKNGIARTYLDFDDNTGKLLGYFTLAIKLIDYKTSSFSLKQKKKFVKMKNTSYTPAYLIGQLARDDKTEKGHGKELLNIAISKIKEAMERVGVSLVYLDCKDSMISYYEKNGFQFLQKNPSDNTLNQMYQIYY